MTTRGGARGTSYWAEFPETYRAEHVTTIAKWIAVGESGVVIGGSGAGKSNLVGFITTRTDVLCKGLPGELDDYAFIHMDVNSLPAVNTPFFYRSMLLGLQNAARQIDPALAQEIQQAAGMLISLDDTLGLHYVLQQAHEILVNGGGKHVVWLIDRFDEACVKLEATTLNSLRNLRDGPQLKGRLSYVVFTRHPLARLRNPRDYDEFHEIMAPNTCWVGPMTERDGRWVAAQMAERHNLTFSDDAIDLLLELSGGLPAFLKAACSALATGMLVPGEPAQAWLDTILEQQSALRNCQEMWDDLTPDEQSALSAIAAGAPEENLDVVAVDYLLASNLVMRKTQETGDPILRVFSPVFELFVLRQQLHIAEGVTLDPRTGALKVNDRVLRTKLTPAEHRLLAYLVEHKGETCDPQVLLAQTWPEKPPAGSDAMAALAQVVADLRSKIELDPAKGVLVQQVDGAGYRLMDVERLVEVHISIDEERFQSQVRKIVDSDFFRGLEGKAREMRQARAATT